MNEKINVDEVNKYKKIYTIMNKKYYF